ncbi:hypothetical protein GF352_03930 [archaeon]|nr:hypothetical protein [archaeon]
MSEVLREEYTFYIKLGGVRAEIACEKEGDELRVVSSYTPEEYRGRGLATKIMKEVVAYTKKNNLDIVPECSFAVHYCSEHEC